MLHSGIRVMRKTVSNRSFVCFLHASGAVPASMRFLADPACSAKSGGDRSVPAFRTCQRSFAPLLAHNQTTWTAVRINRCIRSAWPDYPHLCRRRTGRLAAVSASGARPRRSEQDIYPVPPQRPGYRPCASRRRRPSARQQCRPAAGEPSALPERQQVFGETSPVAEHGSLLAAERRGVRPAFECTQPPAQ